MCLSVHARPSSFRLACTRSLARSLAGGKGASEGEQRARKREGKKIKEGEGETRRMEGKETTYEKRNKKKKNGSGKRMERNTLYAHAAQ